MAIIGSIAWRAIGWALPGLSPSAFYLVAGAVAFSFVGSVAYFKGAEGKGAAIAVERSACNLRISEDARLSAESMTYLLDKIAKAQDDEPKTPAAEKVLCAKSRLCRKGAK